VVVDFENIDNFYFLLRINFISLSFVLNIMKSLKKNTVIGVTFLIILLIIFIGFLNGYNEKGVSGCTEMFCSPTIGVGTERIICNTCFLEDTIFSLGFFKVVKTCQGREYLMFKDGVYIDREVEDYSTTCKYSY